MSKYAKLVSARAQFTEAISILDTGTPYTQSHLPGVLRLGEQLLNEAVSMKDLRWIAEFCNKDMDMRTAIGLSRQEAVEFCMGWVKDFKLTLPWSDQGGIPWRTEPALHGLNEYPLSFRNERFYFMVRPIYV